MLRNGEFSAVEIKRILRRHWWLLLVTTLSATAIGFGLTLVLPKKYTSSTVVLVEPPTVSKDLVPTLMTEDLYHRMASMKEQILSRSRLQPIIEKLNLYPEDRQSKHMEDLVEQLRESIDVSLMQPMAGSFDQTPPGFHVNVTFANPVTAQQICTEITSMFLQQNAVVRTERANVTTQVLTQEVEEAKARLDEQDAKLAQFQQTHPASMPEDQQRNLSLLGGLNTQLESLTQSITRMQQDKTFNETLLNQQEGQYKAAQMGMQTEDSLQQQLTAEESQLQDYLARYTPEHPDMVRLKAQIEETKQRIADLNANKSSTHAPVHEPMQLQQLRTRIRFEEANIADAEKRQAQTQNDIRVLRARIEASPAVQQELKALTRDYQTASDMYNDLLKRQKTSGMVGELENKQQSETFRVLDAPSLPITPSYPKQIAFIGGGAGAGLALGLGIIYLLAFTDKAMYSERDVEVCLKLPVLSIVPSFDSEQLAGSRRRNGHKGERELTVIGR